MIEALLLVLGPLGTLVMPSHTPDNTDPSLWKHPPVPEEWWQLIRDSMPPFEPKKSPTRGMGKIAESFRSWPGVSRSNHPVTSFAALGPNAALITRYHDLEGGLDDRSPLGVWRLGIAPVRFMRQRELVDFGVDWLEENRKG